MWTQPSRVCVRALCASVVTLITLGTPLATAAQTPDTAALIGGWRLTVAANTPDELYLLFMVHEGGTASLRAMDGDKAEGVWIRTARRTFALTLDEFDDTDGDGNDERYRARITIQLSDRNDLTGTASIDEMTLDGSTVVEPEGQLTFEGTRMVVLPE